ncbi:viral membrane associated, early morphogenesis protein [Pteropox virus]|uniref:Viral membrane associated, early morphogenesis protein n=1 Tax=Pteropox virus TaxID=1873698 RepID=A0A1B1MRH9_9POXV|nr:viral membrane associated, early morphogenesis protein [Pteropox virus]ANS71187.1 viral membrane associated, early morphogenesis protein [Pteropox virus]
MSCYIAVIKSIGGLALFQVANGAIELIRHVFMYFCEHKLRSNSFSYVVIRIVINMLMYLILGIVLLYAFQDDKTDKSNDTDNKKCVSDKTSAGKN